MRTDDLEGKTSLFQYFLYEIKEPVRLAGV